MSRSRNVTARILLVSRPKSGSYQAVGLLNPTASRLPHIVDRSGMDVQGMVDYGYDYKEPDPRYTETIERLKVFPENAWGHIAYLPEYADALRSRPTYVLFNMRDPRDVVISRWFRILRFFEDGEADHAWLNYRRETDGKLITEMEDPFSEMIRIEAIQWKNWLGWVDEDLTTVVRYEDLRLRPHETVPALKEKLPNTILLESDAMIRGLLPRPENPSFRKGAVGDWKLHFEPHHKKLAKELFGDILERFGYRA